jgi:hypothetical protein
MKELIEHLTVQMRVAQDRYVTATNKPRIPAPDFQVGYLVLLSAKDQRTTRSSRKLDWKKMGPFPMKRIVSPYVYEMHLLQTMKIHPVCHHAFLKLAPNDTLSIQHQPPPPLVLIKEMQEHAIEEILNSRITEMNLSTFFSGLVIPTTRGNQQSITAKQMLYPFTMKSIPLNQTYDMIKMKGKFRLTEV